MSLPSGIAGELKNILGSEGFLESEEDLRSFAYDLFANHKPDAVALPASVEEVSAVMRPVQSASRACVSARFRHQSGRLSGAGHGRARAVQLAHEQGA